MKLKSVLMAVLASVAVIFIQACGLQVEPETSCNFVRNSQKQRVSWERSLPVKLYLHESVPDVKYIEAIEDAAKRWNDAMGKQMIEIAATGVTGYDQPKKDGYSVVYWQESWDPNKTSEQARTTINWSGDKIFEADVRINAKNFDYLTGEETDSSKVDLEALMVHEFGHVLGLAHRDTKDSVMVTILSHGEQEERRIVSKVDKTSMKCEY